jgi:hypothetical protein
VPHPELLAPTPTSAVNGLQSKLKLVLAGVSATPTFCCAISAIVWGSTAPGIPGAATRLGRAALPLIPPQSELLASHELRTAAGRLAEHETGWLPYPAILHREVSRLLNTPMLPPSWKPSSTLALARSDGRKLAVAQ